MYPPTNASRKTVFRAVGAKLFRAVSRAVPGVGVRQDQRELYPLLLLRALLPLPKQLYTFAIEQNNSVGCSNFEMTGIPGTNYYKDDRLVEFKYFKAKEAEHMLALNDPRPEDVAQVRAYAKDTKQKFPVYNVRSYIVYICANKGWKCWEVTE